MSEFSRFTPIIHIAALANQLAHAACDISKDALDRIVIICANNQLNSNDIDIDNVHKNAIDAYEYALGVFSITNAVVNAANAPYNSSNYDYKIAATNCNVVRNTAVCAYSTAQAAYSTSEMAAASVSAIEGIIDTDYIDTDDENKDRTYNHDVCTDIVYAPIYPLTDTEDD